MIINIMEQVLKRIERQEELYNSPEMKEKLEKNMEERLYYSNGCIGVSSLKASDREGYETAIVLEDSEKIVVVEAYKTIKEMEEGHKFWINMLEENKLKNVYDLKNVFKMNFNTFETYLPENYNELVEFNKQPKK